MKKTGVILLVIFLCIPVFGKEKIPDWIRKSMATGYHPVDSESPAILIYSEQQYEWVRGKVRSTEKYLYQIVNVTGLKYAGLEVPSFKGASFKQFKGYRIDRQGELVDTLDNSDIIRKGFNTYFYDDSETFTARFNTAVTGDFIGFRFTHTRKLPSPDFFIPMGADIEIAYMKIIVPNNVQSVLLNDSDKSIDVAGNIFALTSQPPYPDEPRSPPIQENIPFIAVSWEPGTLNDWKSFSQTFHAKISNLIHLTPEVQADLSELLNQRGDPDFIGIVHRHVTQSINYIAVEYGEGRFIPREPAYVHEKKYGDCKDMACYAAAILTAGKYDVFPVLVRTRDTGCVFESFPGNQFNHMVVAVRLDSKMSHLKNTIIAGNPCIIFDPTDHYTLPPAINWNLEGAQVLPLLPEGSELIRLPMSLPEENTLTYNIDLTYTENKSFTVDLQEIRTGHYATFTLRFLDELAEDKKTELYRNWVRNFIPGSKMVDFKVTRGGNSITSQVTFTAENAGLPVNDAIYLMPNLADTEKKGYRVRTRKNDIDLQFPATIAVNINLTVDSRFRIQSIPEVFSSSNPHFSCEFQCSQDKNIVTINKTFQRKTRRIPAADFKTFRTAYNDYLKHVKAVVIIHEVTEEN